jgi:uncharacterized peroxidase-related enzyme
MAYMEPLRREDVPDLEDVFAGYESTRGFIPNSVLTMARRPGVARAFAALNRAVLYEGTVDPGLKVLVTLIASTAAGCRYCQAHMATRATFFETASDKVDAVWQFEESPLFTDSERAALRLARDALVVPNAVTREHFDELRRHFDGSQTVELVASVALFGYLNRWNDKMATQLEELPLRVTAEHLGPLGWEAGKHAPATTA